MNIHKLSQKVEYFLSSDERKRKQKRKFLKEVIKKLKKHEKKLKERREGVSDESEQKELEIEIGLTRAQRKKGLRNLKDLKKKKKGKAD